MQEKKIELLMLVSYLKKVDDNIYRKQANHFTFHPMSIGTYEAKHRYSRINL